MGIILLPCNVLIYYDNSHMLYRSLERTKQTGKERIQAIKLMKHCMEVDASLFPRTCVQAIVAIAKQQDDPLNKVCLEFLAVLGLYTHAKPFHY